MDVLPLTMVTVSFAPVHVAADIYWITQECTKLCITPLFNMHDTSTPQQVAYNSSKFGYSDKARLDKQANAGDTFQHLADAG